MRKGGILLLVLGLACIAAGILAKRVFDVRQYLLVFHILGGLLILGGGMLIFSDRASGDHD